MKASHSRLASGQPQGIAPREVSGFRRRGLWIAATCDDQAPYVERCIDLCCVLHFYEKSPAIPASNNCATATLGLGPEQKRPRPLTAGSICDIILHTVDLIHWNSQQESPASVPLLRFQRRRRRSVLEPRIRSDGNHCWQKKEQQPLAELQRADAVGSRLSV